MHARGGGARPTRHRRYCRRAPHAGAAAHRLTHATVSAAPRRQQPRLRPPAARRAAATAAAAAGAAAQSQGGSSRRLVVLHSAEAAWYWGGTAAAAAAAAASTMDAPAASPEDEADGGGGGGGSGGGGGNGGDAAAPPQDRARAEAARARVAHAESAVELCELAAADADVLGLADLRKLLLRLCGFAEEGAAALRGLPLLREAARALQAAAAARLEAHAAATAVAAAAAGSGSGSGGGGGGSGSGDAAAPSIAAVGDAASILWCFAELSVQMGRGGGEGAGGADGDGSIEPLEVQPALLEAVSHWLLACAEEARQRRQRQQQDAGDGDGASVGAGLYSRALDPFAGPDGVSLVWGFGRLIAAARAQDGSSSSTSSSGSDWQHDNSVTTTAPAGAASVGAGFDALCTLVADGLDNALNGAGAGAGAAAAAPPSLAPEDLADLADGAAAAARRSPAAARLLDAAAHEAYRRLSNRHSGTAGFLPRDLVKLLAAFAAAGYRDGRAPRMLDAAAAFVARRVRAQHLNAVARPADLAGLLAAYAALRHVSVATPELIRAATLQVCRGAAAAHEAAARAGAPQARRAGAAASAASKTRWTPAVAAALLRAQLDLGFRPPQQQLVALCAALMLDLDLESDEQQEGAPPFVIGSGDDADSSGAWAGALALLEALADCGGDCHPGERLMAALLARAEAAAPADPPPEDCAALLFACARLGRAPAPALLEVAADGAALAAEALGGRPLRARPAVRALWALAALGALTVPRFGWLLTQLAGGRWVALSQEQLRAVAAARLLLGADGRELADEVLPAALVARLDAAWAEGGAAELSACSSGSGSGGDGAAPAASAVVGAWLAARQGGRVEAVRLPADAGVAGGVGWAWLASPPLVGASPPLPPSQRQLVLLAPREALLSRFPPRADGATLLRARLLLELVRRSDGGNGGEDGGSGGGEKLSPAVALVFEDDAAKCAGLAADGGDPGPWPGEVVALRL